jgi:mRNA-degrading endonuclease YafQ of YafQ-DinJ toxin-antitoxin module
MYEIIVSHKFKKAYKKFIKRFHYLSDSIDFAIRNLAQNPFNPSLNTHKLSGELYELFACKCGYDCRIVFSIEKVPGKEFTEILLLDIGTHEDVY